MTVKFSQFVNGNVMEIGEDSVSVGDQLVGLRDGVNIRVNFAEGLKDVNSRFIFGYESFGSGSSNYIKLLNSGTGGSAKITSYGGDPSPDLEIFPGGTTGDGDLLLNTSAIGRIVLNDSTPILGVLDQDNMSSNSNEYVPTQQSVKAYVDSIASGLVDSVTGTANRITITGTAANPIIDIASTYVGQTSLTTLGTIATGTWNATTISTLKGGTGLTSYVTGDLIYSSATNVLSALSGNITTSKQYLSQTGNGAISAAPSWASIAGSDISGSALTKVDDTNVTLTLGGTPATSLLRAASITAGWSGVLSVSRGGTNSGTALSNGLFIVSSGGAMVEVSSSSSMNGQRITSLATPMSDSDAATKLYVDQIALAAIIYQGNWNATTNTPTLTAGVGTVGFAYYVSVAGTQTLPSGVSTAYDQGDAIVYGADLIWNKIDRPSSTVISINGAGGLLTLVGTTNQISVSTLGTTLTLATPQDIAASSSPTFAGLNLSGLTASQLIATDGSKNLQTLTTATYPSLTEISYVKGVTSSIQTQLNAKGTVSSVAMTVPTFLSVSGSPVTTTGTLAVSLSGVALPVANGGTGLSSTTANQILYSSSTSVISGISTLNNGVLVTNGSGVPSISVTLPTNIAVTSPKINTSILDVNGNNMFSFGASASAVNYFSFFNAATLGSPTIVSAGSDANVDMTIQPKGDGTLRLYTGSTSVFDLDIVRGSDSSRARLNLGLIPAATVNTYQFPSFGGVLSVQSNIDSSLTPSDNSGAALTFTSVTASYTRNGEIIAFSIKLTYPVTASGSSASIGGLPVAAFGENIVIARGASLAFGITGLISASGTSIALYNNVSNAAITNANLSGAAITISGSYST